MTDTTATGGAAEAPRRSVGEVVRLAMGADVARLVQHDPIARIGVDTEGVHQMRVATRRLRSHLSTFAPVLREKPARRLGRDLRQLGRALALPRDLDVLAARFERSVASFESMTRDDGGALLRLMGAERDEAMDALRAVLSSAPYRSLLGQLGELVADPPFLRSAGLPAESFLSEAIKVRYDALAGAITALPRYHTDPQLHEVRIVAKPARYAAELGGPILGDDCARLARRLADLCDDLGSLNDGARANEWLDGAGADPVRALAVARIRTVEIDRMAESRASWWRRWERVRASASAMGWQHMERLDGG